MLVVYICAALKISTGTPASRGPSATAGLLVHHALRGKGQTLPAACGIIGEPTIYWFKGSSTPAPATKSHAFSATHDSSMKFSILQWYTAV